jgi:hypothetical protein
VLEFERTVPPTVEPLMGWTESADPFAPIRLEFPDLQCAIEFAERQGWRYDIRETPAADPRAVRDGLRNILSRMRKIFDAAAAKVSR